MGENSASQRAHEVARDLWDRIRTSLVEQELVGRAVRYHLDGSGVFLAQLEAEAWVRDSVDSGFPDVRHYVEAATADAVVINLAAYEDPDSQYWEPSSPQGPGAIGC